MTPMVTQLDQNLVALLHEKVEQGGLNRTARELGFSSPFLRDVLLGKRGVSARLGLALGFELIPTTPAPRRWRKVKEKAGQ